MFEIKNKKFKVNKIVYYDKNSLWGVLGASPIGYLGSIESELANVYGNITISGNFSNIYEGCQIEVTGDIVNNPKFGKQVQVRSLRVLDEEIEDKESVVNFLARSAIAGISIQNAKKIYEKYKEKAIDVVLNRTDELISISGIGIKTVRKVKESVNIYKALKPLIEFGTQLGLPYGLIMKLHEEFGADSVPLIQEDPYRLLELSEVITFKQVDKIYLKNGGNSTDEKRLDTGFLYVLKNTATLEGSTGCLSSLLRSKFCKLLELNISTDLYEKTLSRLEEAEKIQVDVSPELGQVVYYKEYVRIEREIAERIVYLRDYGVPTNKIKDDVVEEEINSFPFTLNEQQIHAIKWNLNKPISVITGLAGCVDGDTEYFNGESWVPIKNYKYGDNVLQYGSDGIASLVQPIRYIKCKADLWHMHNISGTIDQVLSDNHRFIYLSTKGNIKERPFGEVRQMITENRSFSATLINSFRVKDYLTSVITPERLRLLIAVVAEGFLSFNKKFWRVSLKKQVKIQRLKELLKINNLKVEELYMDGHAVFHIPYEYGCKEFPVSFYFLSEELKKVFVEEIFLWDGGLSRCGKKVKKYYTTVKQNADIAQFILCQEGYVIKMSAESRVRKRCSKNFDKGEFTVYTVNRPRCKKVSLRRGSQELKQYGNEVRIERFQPSDDSQYCFEVPSGMLVLRRNNQIFITGNSGKSSIVKALYNIYWRCGMKVFLVAPTAKAARRLEECTGGYAETVHRFLGVGSFNFSEEKSAVEFKNSVIIVDEASMLDIFLFNKLLHSIDVTSKIILVGDNNQLPSVQAGNILGDLIFSNKVPVSILANVMRQSEQSSIIKYCSLINNGELFDPCEESDFHYEEFGTGEELKELLVSKYLEEVNKYGIQEVQVITPYKKGELGMDNLNLLLQDKYNVRGAEAVEPFKVGDRVRHTVNNYKKGVCNGETGIIKSYEDGDLIVDYGDRSIVYDNKDIDELTLSYCSTVHASQGSEYKICFVILDDTAVNDYLFIRRLLYTAVSRGKVKVYIFSKPYLLDKCITNAKYRPRITKLLHFLRSQATIMFA